MRALAIGLPLLLLQPQAQEATSYSARIGEVVSAHSKRDLEAALGTLEGLLAEGQPEPLAEWQRAEVQYALGVVLAARNDLPPDPLNPPPDVLEAAPSFESARALAGPTALRRDATYNLGGVFLREGERLRLTLPEVANAGAQGLPAPPSMPPSLPADEASDPLERARASYQSAKEHLLERLRADWRDEDTRANLELIQRRLAELDRIQEQREQQQQEQEQEQDEEGEQGEGEQGEEQESDEESEGDESEEDPSESDSEGNPEQQEPQAGPPEEPQTQETQPPEEGGEAQAPESSEPQERLLTREEVMRLLDRLGELEQQREELEAALRQSQRVPVPRDW